MKKLLFLAFILLYDSLSMAFTQPTWTGFDKESGLSSNSITSSLVDNKGNLWLATGDGLSVFDGKQWIIVAEIKNTAQKTSRHIGKVLSLWEDEGGNIWIAADNNLFIFTGTYWIEYERDILENFTARIIYQDSHGDIWICSDFKEKQDFLGTNVSQPVIRGSVARFNGEIWSNYFLEAGGCYTIQKGEEEKYYTGLIEDDFGFIWIASVEGVYMNDGIVWKQYTTEDQLPANYVNTIFKDSKGMIWVGTHGGTACFDGQKWISYYQRDGIGGNNSGSFYEDRRGNIWIYTHGNMLFQGLSRFDGRNWTHYRVKDGFPAGNVKCLKEDKTGKLWALTRDGLSSFDGERWNLHNELKGLKGQKFYAMLPDSAGNIWVGTNEGIYKYNGESWNEVFKAGEERSGWDITIFYEDYNGTIWAGTSKYGLVSIEGGVVTIYDISSGLIDKSVIDILEDGRGNIWAISKKGISKFNR